MTRRLPPKIKYFVLILGLIFSLPFRSNATHFYGADLNYTYVSGNTYTINFIVWGDCSGAAFYTLPTSVPVVYIYNGATLYSSVNLIIQAPTSGIEVTPVCPADSNNTTCKNVSNPIPGIKKFVYSANVTLSGPSSVWRFVFTGNMGPSNSAGRSNSITNIMSGTIVQLIDTLNNITVSNSSPALTNIPTPFFCDNYAANYNPAAVDPNNDSLTFFLVPGTNGTTLSSVGGPITYIAPYTATSPLGVSGSIAFNNQTGQLSFTPNLIQRSLVVYNIEEHKNGILVGTSQREMTFVVLTCNDGPPTGSITNASAGTIVDSTDFKICQSVGPFTFNINPTEASGNNITMTVAGLPAGAIFSITNNGTPTPQGLFSWSTTGIALGSYTFYITYQDDACPLSSRQTQAYTITILPSPTLAVSLVSAATCSHDAVISITPGGISTPLTINVLQSGNIIQTINSVTGTILDSLAGGTYTIRVLNSSLCNKDTTITLAQPPILVPIVSMVSPTCYGGSNGSITVTGSNSLAPYLYAIGGGSFSTTNIFSPLSAGTYVLHVEDANNCTKDTTVNLADAIAIGANMIIKKPSCNNFANGSVIVNAYNSVPPYQYALGAGSFGTSDTFSNLAPGTYAIHIKSSVGCTKDTSVTLVDSTEIHAALTISNLQCNNDSSGSIIVNASGAYLLPYNYILNANTAVYSGTFSHLSAGTYAIQVHDSEHCYFDTSVTITQPNPLSLIPVTTDVYCNGSATGIIILSVGGGTPNYEYNINGGGFSGNSTFSNLTAGTYIVDVKDADNCILSDTTTIQQPSPIVLTISQNPLLCHGDANASFTVTATGGTLPFEYALNAGNFQVGNTFTGLGPGSYTFSVRDGNNCIKDTVITLTDPPSTFANITIKRPSCNGFANGMIVVNGHNSVAPYQYALGNGAYGTADTFANIASGTYTIKIKNANGCIYDTSVTFTDSTQLHASVQLTNILCHGGSTGIIVINPTGAYLQPYNYIINAGSAVYTNTFSNLPAGTYAIQVHDSEQCYFDTSITLLQPLPITITPLITNVNCNGSTSGAITVNAAGGTPAYQYNINSGGFGAANLFNNLSAGVYGLQVQDANGCLMSDTVAVTQSTPIIITSVTMQQPLCNGNANGSFTILVSGGQQPYTYAYNAGIYQAGNVLSGLPAGTYTLHVKDAYGCIKDTTVTLAQPTPVVPAALVTNSTCNTLSNGQIVLSASGGTPGYTYALGAGAYAASGTFTPLASGTYTLHVKDANGCVKDTSVTITNTLNVSATATVTPTLCYNQASGMVVVSGVGGASPYMYQVGAGSYGGIDTFPGLSALTYNIHIKDANGCIYDTNIVVTQPSNILPNISITPPTCYGYSNGSITIGATGGTPAYAYQLDNNVYQSSGSYTGLPASTDTLYIKDANGCIHDTVVMVTQPSPFVIDSLVLTGIKCFAGNSGSITVFASGGVQPYTFAANSGSYQSANILIGLYAGPNTIQVKDNEGCMIDSGANLTQPPPLIINTVSIVNPTCEGYKDGAVSLTAGGGTMPYFYSADNTTFTATDSFASLPAGTYTYYAKDSNGCIADTTLTLTGYPAIIVSAANTKEPSCYGYHDGAIYITATGGLPPFTYGIIDSAIGTSPVFDSLFSGAYNIVITDSKGCKIDTLVGLPQPDSLSIEITKIVPNNCYGLDTNGYISVDAAGGTIPYAYKWNTDPVQIGPDASGLANGNYIVVVTDANNCADTTGTKVDYDDCCKPFIPNAFTPNNDGKDDIFRIVFKGDMQLIEFSVYNRFGQCVFTTSDVNKGWDGNFNGTPADMDTYFYYARIICGTDHKVSLKGDVTLIR